LARAADAIGLAALRAPSPQQKKPQPAERPERSERPRRRPRRIRLRAGRLMFAAAVLYLLGTGAVGEVQLMHVRAQEQQALQQLQATERHNAGLRAEARQLRTTAGEAQAVRDVLHYVPAGDKSVVLTVQR